MEEPPSSSPEPVTRGYLFRRFLRYGFLAWGGPVAQIGLMHRELVERDRWIGEERFRKVFALYQALPGPEAHELAVYFGMIRGGRWGGFLTGLGFMLPGVVLVTLLAAVYQAYATLPELASSLLYGVRPAVLALVAAAFLRLSRRALTAPLWLAIAAGTVAASLLAPQIPFPVLLLWGGLLGLLREAIRNPTPMPALLPLGLLAAPLSAPLWLSFVLLYLQVGLLTFGGAYTSIPILHQGAVVEHAWLTDAQFLDALALTALVPGPLIAVGTFIGYLAAGVPGAVVATILIFAPAFMFTLVGHHYFERIIDQPRVHGFLLGVTAAALGLIARAGIELADAAVSDVATLVIAVVAFALLVWRPLVPWVVLGSAVAGLLLGQLL